MTPTDRQLEYFLEREGIIASMTQAMDDCIEKRIPDIIQRPIPLSDNRGSLRFELIPGESKDGRKLFAQAKPTKTGEEMTVGQALKAKENYTVSFKGHWYHDTPGQSHRLNSRSVTGLTIFLPVGSKYSSVYGKRDTEAGRLELLRDGLSDADPFQWFVVDGRKRIVKSQEKLIFDKPLVSYFIDRIALACQTTVKVHTGTHRMRISFNYKINTPLCREIGVNLMNMFSFNLSVYRTFRLMNWPEGNPFLRSPELKDELKRKQDWYQATNTDVRNWIRLFDDKVRGFLAVCAKTKRSMAILDVSRHTMLTEAKISDEDYMAHLWASRMGAKGKTKAPEKKDFTTEYVFNRIYSKFFHNLTETYMPSTYQEFEIVRNMKLNMLAYMTAIYIEVIAGLRPPDDRDMWINKHVDIHARLIEHLVATAWSSAENIVKTGDVNELGAKITDFVWKTFYNSFRGNTWGVPSEYNLKQGVVYDLLSETIPIVYSEVTQIRPPISTRKTQVNKQIRSVQRDQAGFIDPLYTPENEQVGLIKSFGLVTVTTLEQDERSVRGFILAELGRMRETKSGEAPPLFFKALPAPPVTILLCINERPLTNDNGEAVRVGNVSSVYLHFRALRRAGKFPTGQPHHVNFGYYPERLVFNFFMNGGRLSSPLLIVEPNASGTDVDVKLLRDSAGGDTQGLLDKGTVELTKLGYVEYLDVNERKTLGYVADSTLWINQLRDERAERKRDLEAIRDMPLSSETKSIIGELRKTATETEEKNEGDREVVELLRQEANKLEQAGNQVLKRQEELYRRANRDLMDLTHVEMDPQAVLGLASALNPAVNYAPAPRGSFQTKMGTHAIGCMPDFDHSLEPTTKSLFFSHRPFFVNQVNKYMQLDRYPAGVMTWVAIMALDENQEDELVMNKDIAERCAFMYLTGRAKKIVVYAGQGRERPVGGSQTLENEGKYRGVVKIGTTVNAGDVLVNITQTSTSLSGQDEKLSRPAVLEEYETGLVMGREVLGSKEDIIVIHIVELRKYKQGDKLAARFSQKGMVGVVKESSELPKFLVDGMEIIPGLIINPTGVFGRNTTNLPIEGIMSFAAMLEGKRMDASSFRHIDLDAALDVLRANGIPEDLKFTAINPLTQQPYENKIALMPLYYQALPHHYVDKVQMRGPGGSRKMETWQPLGHRQAKGGSAQQFGEQERDAAMSHGAVRFARDRLCVASDTSTMVVCIKCGSQAREDIIRNARGMKSNVVCTSCGSIGTEREKLLKVPDVPGVLNTFQSYLNAMGIRVNYVVSPVQRGMQPYDLVVRRALDEARGDRKGT